jgi:large subunit ribosomal protein L16
MLSPKRTKYRKNATWTYRESRNNRLVHGEYGIQALEPVWLTSRIEAVRRTITRYTKRTGKLWIKVFQIKLLLLVQKNHVWDLEKVLLIIG